MENGDRTMNGERVCMACGEPLQNLDCVVSVTLSEPKQNFMKTLLFHNTCVLLSEVEHRLLDGGIN